MLVLSLTDAETCSYHKVNSYYDYYMYTPHLLALRGEMESLMMHSATLKLNVYSYCHMKLLESI